MNIVLDNYYTGDFVFVDEKDLEDPCVVAFDCTDHPLPDWAETQSNWIIGSFKFSEEYGNQYYVFVRFANNAYSELAIYTGLIADKSQLLQRLNVRQ